MYTSNAIIMLTDSYKLSHYKLYPTDIKTMYSYMEARGGKSKEIIFTGLNHYLHNYLRDAITGKDIAEAKAYAELHGEPFNGEGWNYILKEHNGYLPITIEALPDDSKAKIGEPLFLIHNTDPKCLWLVSYIETLIMKVWYPCTVATRSHEIRKIMEPHWMKTVGNTDGVDFAFHNFGDRGASSVESALIGGGAHLTEFKGTDNFNCMTLHKPAYSIVATDHCVVTSWGRENEFRFYDHLLEVYKDKDMIACVMDSYDIYKAVNYMTSGERKDKIESDEYPKFILRPDSGRPHEVIPYLLGIMAANKVKSSINAQGFISFDKYGIIWGDGITKENISDILEQAARLGYAADNFAFGCGGYLMQNLNRDTHQMAIKCCAVELLNGTIRDVYKDPITDPGKASKRGIQRNERFVTVYRNGSVV